MHFLRSEVLTSFPAVVHGLGTKETDSRFRVREEWKDKPLFEGNELLPLVTPRQVHGNRVVVFTGQPIEDILNLEADALITRERGQALGVFTADCLPILLFDPIREAIGVVHAGWRGTSKGIIIQAVRKLRETFDCRPEEIRAVLGPCIGPCCYEVDGPVRNAFLEAGLAWERTAAPRTMGTWSLDLKKANALVLMESGLKPGHVHTFEHCTCCSGGQFFSYRADGTDGRQLNFIGLRRREGSRKTS